MTRSPFRGRRDVAASRVGVPWAAARVRISLISVSDAVSAGAPGWVNIVVLVLAWDAIKVSCSAVGVVLRVARFAMARIGGLVLRDANEA